MNTLRNSIASVICPRNDFKFAFGTDPHLISSPDFPRSRIDDYEDAVFSKLEFFFSKAQEDNNDAIILGGDFFHSSRAASLSGSAWTRLFELLRSVKIPIYTVIGNHCIHGSIDNLDKCSIGVLLGSGHVRLLSSLSIWNSLKTKYLKIFGFPVLNSATVSSKFMEELCSLVESPSSDEEALRIGVGHFDVVNWRGNVGLDSAYFSQNHIHWILSGHIHQTLGSVRIGETDFITPGSITRNVSDTDVLDHEPIFLNCTYHFDSNNIDVSPVKIPCKPASVCFNVDYKDAMKSAELAKESMTSLMQSLSSTSGALATKDQLAQIIKEKSPRKDITEYILSTLDKVS